MTDNKDSQDSGLSSAQMMIIAIIVRVKIKDSFFVTLPAIIYALLNFIICYISILEFNTQIIFGFN